MMNNNEDFQRGMPQQPSRRPYVPNKYQENRYSPSSNYNYNHSSAGGGYNSPQQHQKRKIERFKRESVNYSERIIRQNDIIIRVLKEIRDRLPAAAAGVQASAEGEAESACRDDVTEEARKTDTAQAVPEESPSDDDEIGNEADTDAEPSEGGNR